MIGCLLLRIGTKQQQTAQNKPQLFCWSMKPEPRQKTDGKTFADVKKQKPTLLHGCRLN